MDACLPACLSRGKLRQQVNPDYRDSLKFLDKPIEIKKITHDKVLITDSDWIRTSDFRRGKMLETTSLQ